MVPSCTPVYCDLLPVWSSLKSFLMHLMCISFLAAPIFNHNACIITFDADWFNWNSLYGTTLYVCSWCWLNQSVHDVCSIRVFMMLAQSECFCCWLDQCVHDVGSNCWLTVWWLVGWQAVNSQENLLTNRCCLLLTTALTLIAVRPLRAFVTFTMWMLKQRLWSGICFF